MFCSALIETFSIGLVPVFVSLILDIERTVETINFQPIKEIILNINREQLLVFFSIFLVLFFILKNIFVLIVLFLENLFFFKFKTFISTKIFSLYVDKRYNFHIEKSPPELLRNVINESANVSTIILLLLSSSREVIVFLTLFIFLLYLNPIVTLTIFILLMIFSFLFIKLFKNRIFNWGKKSQGFNKDLLTKINEVFNSIKFIKISNTENIFKENFFNLFKQNEKLGFFTQFINRSIRSYFELFSILSISLLVIILKINNFNFSNFLIVLSLAAISIVRVLPIFNTVIGCITQIRFLQPSVNVIYQELKTSNSALKKSNFTLNKNLDFNSLKLVDVNFSYSNGIKTLTNINIEFNKGDKIGIIGKTGSGKSTLLDIMLGLQSPSKGKVLYNGETINYEKSNIPFAVGYVPQDIYLLDNTIINNIVIDNSNYIKDDDFIYKFIDDLCLTNLIQKNDQGLNTLIGNNGIKLSGGEKQRIGIARALINNPKILFFDEATSALDNSTEKRIMNKLIDSKPNLSTVIIAHRLSTLESCNKVIYLENGVIKDSGTIHELIDKYPELKSS